MIRYTIFTISILLLFAAIITVFIQKQYERDNVVYVAQNYEIEVQHFETSHFIQRASVCWYLSLVLVTLSILLWAYSFFLEKNYLYTVIFIISIFFYICLQIIMV